MKPIFSGGAWVFAWWRTCPANSIIRPAWNSHQPFLPSGCAMATQRKSIGCGKYSPGPCNGRDCMASPKSRPLFLSCRRGRMPRQANTRSVGDMADAEWSLQLMRCELSQCVREGLINLLQGAGLWTSDVQLRAVLAESRTRGADLQQQLVAPALGSADHAYLIAEKAFGIPRHGLRKSIPLSLSFGYYLGAGIHDYLGLDAASRDGAARLCALFNLLTVIFDRTCDDFNRGVTELSRCFGEANMLALADHPRGSHELAEAAGAVQVPEIRILLKIISAFYLQAGHY